MNSSMSQDPHLSSENEKRPKCPAVFFFGAGASVPAKVPDTVRFVEDFQKTLKGEKLDAFNRIKEMLESYIKKQKYKKDEPVDIELILETLIRIENYEDDPLLSNIFSESDMDILKKVPPLKISIDLKDFIREKCLVKAEDVGYLQSLRDLINLYGKYGPIEVITTNYDTLLEQFCTFQKLKLEDGFGGIFESDRLHREDADIRLFKLHGSILWYKSNTGAYYKLPIVSHNLEITAFGEELEPLIIYPMRKWEYVEPTFEITVKAMKIMRSLHIKFIYVFGYSFRDEHIRNMFFDVFRERQDVYCVLIDPNAYGIYEAITVGRNLYGFDNKYTYGVEKESFSTHD